MYRHCKMNVNKNEKKIVLELLNFCNLNCKHCLYKFKGKEKQFLSKNKSFSLIDKASKKGLTKLVLTGGEPTLHPDFFEIANYAISKITKVSICTNGYFSSEKSERKVAKLNFSTFTVSIDSHIDRVHDEFRGRKGALKKTIHFLEELKRAEKNISIHTAIHPANLNHIEDTIDFCKQFSPEIVIASIYYCNDHIKDGDVKQYMSELEKFKSKYKNHPDIILVGFEKNMSCTNKHCLDQKNVFMINKNGELVTCYWKKDGGKIVSRFAKF
jgi:MoaA/NifB/PqqE/SkfB family radical SAM enzyme